MILVLSLQLYLDQREPKISHCYRMINAYAEEYPELLEEIPSESCFRRKIKTLPFAVTEYARKGEKAFHDKCTPYANHDKSNIYANDIWVMDNYTFDVIIKQENDSKATKRMYLTTVLNVKSGVLVGWNITNSPDSNSTLDALRFAMLRFRIPKQLYFDNGREFTTLDIAGDKRNRKVAKDKKGNLPVTIIAKLGIEIIFALPTNVERIHRIIKEQYCITQNGYCGGNIMERPENLKKMIKYMNIETEAELRESFADTVNILKTKFNRLKDIKYALHIEKNEIENSINHLYEAGYLHLKNLETKQPSSLADTDFDELESKLTAKGIQLLAGVIQDECVEI